MTAEKRLRIAWPTNQPWWMWHVSSSRLALHLLLKFDVEDAAER